MQCVEICAEKMKEKSWVCTLITQLSLCIAAYIALNVRRPQIRDDIYFISVIGGFRPLQQQTTLLQQISKAARAYKAQFVVDISEFGDSDPLLHNATAFPVLQNIPWYATGASVGQGKTYFLKKFKSPCDKTIDILALDTLLFKDSPSVSGADQMKWLRRTLKDSDSDWRIGVGFHQLQSRDCINWTADEEAFFDTLHKTLLLYRMNAYLSSKICAGHAQRGALKFYDSDPSNEHPYMTPLDQNHGFRQEASDGFFLHRIGSSEMVSFVHMMTVESFGHKSRAAA